MKMRPSEGVTGIIRGGEAVERIVWVSGQGKGER